MTTYFVSNAGSNTAPYDTEAKAANKLSTILAIPAVAADIIKVSSTHTETEGAAITLTLPTSPGLQILCVAFNGSGTGALATGGAVNVGASSAAFIVNNCAYFYGVTLVGGTTANSSASVTLGNSAATHAQIYESCTISCPNTNTGARIVIGETGASGMRDSYVRLVNSVCSNGVDKTILLRNGVIEMDGCSLAGTGGTTVFSCTNGNPTLIATGCDFSGAGTNPAMVTATTSGSGVLLFKQCKFKTSFSIATGTFSGPGSVRVIASDCHSGDTQNIYAYQDYSGLITLSTGIYADASNGDASFSLCMVAHATNASFIAPLVSPPISFFNASLSAMTTQIETVNDGTTFKNNELWQETLAKVTSTSTQATWDRSNRAADITTAGSNQPTSSATWTGADGFGSKVRQYLQSGSFTPAEVGQITTIVKLAKAGATVYVSPKALSTSAKQWLCDGTFVNDPAASGGFPVFGGPFT